MSSNKDQQFTERLSTAASDRRAMLEKFQARRAVDDPAAHERRAAQEAMRAAREARRAEREAARHARQEQLSAERLARKAAEREQRPGPRHSVYDWLAGWSSLAVGFG